MWSCFIRAAAVKIVAVKIVAVELILIQYLPIHIRSTSRFICSDTLWKFLQTFNGDDFMEEPRFF